MDWLIEGGSALMDGGFTDAPVAITGGVFAARSTAHATRIDARELFVLPGIVDIHGDAFEQALMPRPRVPIAPGIALAAVDRQLIANGITTAFHGLTVSWEPGLRCLDNARAFVAALGTMRPHLAADTRLHLRWETFAFEAMADVTGWLASDLPPILAFNDHTTMLFDSGVEAGYVARKLDKMSARAGIPGAAYRALVEDRWARRAEVPGIIAAMAASARAVGVTLLGHDETSPRMRAELRALGAVTCEFPMTLETARAARAAGEHVVLGAPNVVRGGSHNNTLNAAAAVAGDLCTVLASDYYYPAPLLAAFRLAEQGITDLADAWALVSRNAAEAAGLTDRGEIAPGRRADLILVDTHGPLPRVVVVIVGGRRVYAA
ncbi:MAG: alpha-D-ribose 1-methylphosphonate 5-triphosphate diphosphatase [Alphaproteobacteria bacterium]